MIPIGIPAAYKQTNYGPEILFNFQGGGALVEQVYGWPTIGTATKIEPAAGTSLPTTDCMWLYGAPPPAESTLEVVGAAPTFPLAGDWTLDLIVAGENYWNGLPPETVTPYLDCTDGTTGWRLLRRRPVGTDPLQWHLEYYVEGILTSKAFTTTAPSLTVTHLRLCCNAGTLRMFSAGVLVAALAMPVGPTVVVGNLRIAHGFTGAYQFIYGLHLVEGIALSTTNDSFTPLTVPLLPI